MIRYALKCDQSHEFDSWFPSAEGYEKLQASGLVECPVCGSSQVRKSMMAPPVRASRNAAVVPMDDAAQPEPSAPKPVSLTEPGSPVAEALAKLREEVERSSDYVGERFVSEARAMHLGDRPERAIYGEARLEDAKELAEEGIPVLPLPFSSRGKAN